MGDLNHVVSSLSVAAVPIADNGKKAGLNFKVYQELKSSVHRDLLNKIDVEKVATMRDERTRSQALAVIQDLVANLQTPLSGRERERLSLEVLDEVFGLGPLEPLLQDPGINDILVNGHQLVYVERAGMLEETNIRFKDDAHLMHIIDKIVSAVGRRVDESSPMVDARLADGSRINVVIPPLAVDGPVISIRRFSAERPAPDRLVELGSLTQGMRDLLEDAVVQRRSILISGGTGSGKTTLLNALSSFIAPGERVVTIEDAAELRLQQPYVVRLESRPAGVEGRGEVTIRDLLRNALRMRPDRIVIGEVRGAEALDLLTALNTGHDGALSTLHASSCEDAIRRLETLSLMAGVGLPHAAIREQLARGIDLVVHLA